MAACVSPIPQRDLRISTDDRRIGLRGDMRSYGNGQCGVCKAMQRTFSKETDCVTEGNISKADDFIMHLPHTLPTRYKVICGRAAVRRCFHYPDQYIKDIKDISCIKNTYIVSEPMIL